MEWWQTYLLWKLDTIQGIGIGFTIAAAVFIFGAIIYLMVETDRSEKGIRNSKLILKIVSPIFVFFLLIACIVPSTDSAIKMIMTKYGIDIVKSEHIQNTGENLVKALENASKLLEQKTAEAINPKMTPEKGN